MQKTKPKVKITVAVALTQSEVDALDQLAYEDGSNRSQIIRKALRAYMASELPKEVTA